MERIHFIAIGGSAMHNLALALHYKGSKVSGSDDEIFEPSRGRLKKQGLLPESEGWYPEKITDELDAVIVGMHARKDNPELLKAKEIGLPIFSYPEYLYEQSKDKTRVVIGGSHGKTTTTAMILHVLHKLKMDCDYMVGAQLEGFDTMVRLTENAPVMIIEGDEYLTSPIDRRPKFHLYKPHIAVITGIAWDHMNVFPTLENYLEQFKEFLNVIEPGGTLIPCYEDEEVKKLVETHSRKDLTILPYKVPEYNSGNEEVFIRENEKSYKVAVFGRHNLMNIEAARKVCIELGVNEADFYRTIASFKGASGRLQKMSGNASQVVYRDFAHAPSKVKATVEAVREMHPEKKIIAVLELHTFSSLNKDFLPHYQNSMSAADEKVVFYLQHTLKMKRLPELHPAEVREYFNENDLAVINSSGELKQYLDGLQQSESVLLLMSSGNFGGIQLA